jgi:hypothetical protein
MRKPVNLDAFIELVNSMDHRERFVFEANNSLKSKYNETYLYIEIYNTVLYEKEMHPRNITIHLVSLDGKPIIKKAKMHKLWNKDFYQTVYSMFASEVSEKNTLQLSE